MRGRFFLPAVLVVVAGFTGLDEDAPRAPRNVNIVATCSPSQNPAVQPSQITIRFADNVVWRVAGPAASFTITPKDPQRWPFAQTIGGNPQSPANSGVPPAGTAAGKYLYNVNITCPDGSTQVIDPEIIIGENE